MPCDHCYGFPAPTSNFPEVGVSLPRHGTLYRCKRCGALIEVIAEEKGGRFITEEDARRYYGFSAPKEG